MRAVMGVLVAGVCVLALLLALVAPVQVQADLPIHCLNAQVAGDWTFTLDKGGNRPKADGDTSVISCGYPQPDHNIDHFTRPPVLVAHRTMKVTLKSPNIVKDEEGNEGTWTMIYDEGFEVKINGYTFFAFNKYVPNSGTSLTSDKVAHYTSHCDETMVGWFHDKEGNWGCYKGKQTKAAHAHVSRTSKQEDDGLDIVPVVSPTALLEEFTRVLHREEDEPLTAAQRAARRRNAPLMLRAPIVSASSSSEGADELEGPRDALAMIELDRPPHPRSHISNEFPELDDSLVFEPDHVFIERHNSNRRNLWRAGAHQQFQRKPVKEMLRMLGLSKYQKDVTGPGSRKFRQPIHDDRPDSVKYAGLPTNWDWSDLDGISYDVEIRNQGSCGSCYAMATISAIEARFRVKSRLAFRPILSPQEVVSCSFYNQGCEGGYPFLVAKHGAEFGYADAECVPYVARNAECKPQCQKQRVRVSNYSYVGGYMGGCNEVAMMREIYANGPVMVAFQAPPDLFYYTGGIYTGPSPKEEAQGVHGVNVWQQTNHAVVAVGWGVDAKTGVKYWKLKNTWGLKWGENGYFRIRRGTNECGVESMATKADVILPDSVSIPSDAPDPYASNGNKGKVGKAKLKSARFQRRQRRRSLD